MFSNTEVMQIQGHPLECANDEGLSRTLLYNVLPALFVLISLCQYVYILLVFFDITSLFLSMQIICIANAIR